MFEILPSVGSRRNFFKTVSFHFNHSYFPSRTKTKLFFQYDCIVIGAFRSGISLARAI